MYFYDIVHPGDINLRCFYHQTTIFTLNLLLNLIEIAFFLKIIGNVGNKIFPASLKETNI